MSGIGHTPARNIHLTVLRKDIPSPLSLVESREDHRGQSTPDSLAKVEIDFEDIEHRIISLPVPTANYTALYAGKPGILYLLESRTLDLSGAPTGRVPSNTPLLLHKFVLSSGKMQMLGEGIRRFVLSCDGERILCRLGDKWIVLSSAEVVQADREALDLDRIQVSVDPVKEWRQICDEVWRFERDFFYDPSHHGLDMIATKQKYEPFLDGIVTREQLNLLIRRMLREFSVSHIGVNGGDTGPWGKHPEVGFLGADYEVSNGRYRFKRIFRGDPWDPRMRAPLARPGTEVAEGEYLLAVDGRELDASDNVRRFLNSKVNQPISITVSSDSAGTNAREISVMPVSSVQKGRLQRLAWRQENQRTVDRMTDGRVAYISPGNTSGDGYVAFSRQLAGQQDKLAVIVDLRGSGGGRLADYIVQRLDPLVLGFVRTRDGEDMTIPLGAIRGPKAMLIDEGGYSGVEALADFFRRAGLGPLVGKRTSGGLVGVGAALPLLDGGWLAAPSNGIYGPDGKWVAEGIGIIPDIEVDQDPAALLKGRDPQLEKAVEIVLDALEKDPPHPIRKPDYKRFR
jgi:tricorn protease